MTLSNVFMGKKVVQQIYMNNALIYQANGWQPLPSTPQTVWQKILGNGNAYYSVKFDNNNNLVMTYYYNNATWAMKVDPDGNVLWNNRIDTTDNVQLDIYIDKNNYIYCVTTYTTGQYIYKSVIRKIDSNGNLVKSVDITIDISRHKPISITYDENYIYILDNSSCIYTYDLSGTLISAKSGITYSSSRCIFANQDYILIGASTAIYKVPKSGIGNSTKNGVEICNYTYANKMKFDQYNNLYYMSGSGSINEPTEQHELTKFSLVDNKKSWPSIAMLSSSYIIDFCIDYQCNIYVLCYDSSVSKYLMNKYGADGTLQWSTDLYNPFSNAVVAVDTNGNVYQVGASLCIKKLINLIKKG